MFRDPSKEPLSKAQIAFMDEKAPTLIAWFELTGQAIGMTIQPWQRRIVNALIRKDVLTPDGQVTDSGKKAWARAIERMGRRRKSA
jgi:hypothetical protein